MTSVINHWINGELQPSTSERYGDVFNPATGEVSASVSMGNSDDLNKAVEASTALFRSSELPIETDALTSPVAGLNTSPYLSDVDGCNSPLIQ